MPRRKFNLSWGQALAEIALIFIGITLAVFFNNWNEQRKDSALRESYYSRLIAEIEQDRQDLQGIISYHQIRQGSITAFFDFLDAYPSPDPDSLQHYIREISYHMSSYVPNESTFQELIATGNIKLMPTEVRERLLRLARMHAYVHETYAGFLNRYDNRRDQLAAIVDEATFYGLRNNPPRVRNPWTRDHKSAGFQRFSNLLAVRLNIANTMLQLYATVDKQCEELLNLLAKENQK